MAKMSVDDKLGLDLFHTDEHNPHITVNEDYDDMEEIRKVLLACPAGLYHYENGKVTFISEPYVAHGYHGTGDVFSSVLCAALLRGRSLCEATGIAAEFVRRTIRNTAKNNPNLWYGVNFEGELASLSALLAD
jgi:ferredoxin-like protein FixX